MTALALPNPKAAKIPRGRARACHACLAGNLVRIWGGELWPIPAVGAVAIGDGLGRWTAASAVGGVAMIANYWHRGRLRDNRTDTMAAVVRWDWTLARLAKPTMPKLIKVTVRQPHSLRQIRRHRKNSGRIGIPAAQMQLTILPHENDNPGSAEWRERFEGWASRRYSFSAWELSRSEMDPHVWVLDLAEMVSPYLVTAFEDED